MILIGESARVCKAWIERAQFFCGFIHKLCELAYTARAMNGKSCCGIVTRAEHKTVKEFLDGKLFTCHEVNRRAFNALCFARYCDDIIKSAVFDYDESRHYFRSACHCSRCGGIWRKEDSSWACFHKHGAFRGELDFIGLIIAHIGISRAGKDDRAYKKCGCQNNFKKFVFHLILIRSFLFLQ